MRRRRTDPDHMLAVVLMALAVVGVAATFFIGCTPEQSSEWLTWRGHDKDGAGVWLASPEGQASLTDPAIDVPAPPPPPQPALRNRQGDRVWNYIARCESGGRWDYPPITNSSGTYSGGLMIGHRWWEPLGGRQFAQWPYLATRAEQIHIAEKIVDAQGLDRGWQCYP